MVAESTPCHRNVQAGPRIEANFVRDQLNDNAAAGSSFWQLTTCRRSGWTRRTRLNPQSRQVSPCRALETSTQSRTNVLSRSPCFARFAPQTYVRTVSTTDMFAALAVSLIGPRALHKVQCRAS